MKRFGRKIYKKTSKQNELIISAKSVMFLYVFPHNPTKSYLQSLFKKSIESHVT